MSAYSTQGVQDCQPTRLLKDDASPPGCAGYAQGKDAGSGRSSATDATEDDAWRRPVLSGGRGLVLQQPPGEEGKAGNEQLDDVRLRPGQFVTVSMGA